ncbi:MAG: GSCFA domain-containing protein [Proteobacteria bacterium]|nr:GSCFA domain-containing protein [Pseudomonadota bacterium]
MAEAIPLLRAAVASREEWPEAQYQLGVTLLGQGDLPAARNPLRKAITLRPNWPETHFGYARAWFGSNQPDHYARSQTSFARACALKPDWSEAWFNLGGTLSMSSSGAEVVRALRLAAALAPARLDARYMLAQELTNLGMVREAVVQYERIATVDRTHANVLNELAWSRRAVRNMQRRDRLARYPRKNAMFQDLPEAIRKFVIPDYAEVRKFLRPDSRVFAMGSCFAENITRGLKRLGVHAEHVGYPEDINSTYANRYLLEWVQDRVRTPSTQGFEEVFGESGRLGIREQLERADIVILSLGVAPSFFDRKSGAFVSTLGQNINVALLVREFEFRTTTVAENVDNIRAIVDRLRRLNPSNHVVLTVSPVPLKVTFEFESAITADCVSKSTLRVAAHEVMKLGLPRIHYWPSFEMVRWTAAGHVGPVFGTDDGSPLHVSQELVDTVVSLFLEAVGEPDAFTRREANQAPAPVRG